VFGPVLHFVRYRRGDLDALLARINATGYGLTMGLHTRIDETIARVTSAAQVGNLYVNRNMVGAVVGVQPFGGEGLSGTGPKAGGPLYLYRLLGHRPPDVLERAMRDAGGPADGRSAGAAPPALQALATWARAQGHGELASACGRLAALAPSGESACLAGPTGERNVYRLVARRGVLCLAADDHDRLVQLAAVLAVGGRAVWPAAAGESLARLPPDVRSQVSLASDLEAAETAHDCVLLHGRVEELAQVQARLVRREGAVVGVERMEPGDRDVPLERLVTERSMSINTAAAGGNASLMAVG
jgi:RHH-type transcriptional regulator, proline utilization regulon repressor / proline dehydrogenase / delta 1-pyrroline-5-carboxylate dehydrogenase